MKRITGLFSSGILLSALVAGAGCAQHHDEKMGSTSPASAQAESQQVAVDLHNTVCPVSGDKVGDSKLTEVYQGKIYHLCCDDCPKDFQKDPSKYAKAVAADPDKYGVKK